LRKVVKFENIRNRRQRERGEGRRVIYRPKVAIRDFRKTLHGEGTRRRYEGGGLYGGKRCGSYFSTGWTKEKKTTITTAAWSLRNDQSCSNDAGLTSSVLWKRNDRSRISFDGQMKKTGLRNGGKLYKKRWRERRMIPKGEGEGEEGENIIYIEDGSKALVKKV